MIWLGVAATSAVGAAARYSVMAGFERRFDRRVPWGTALINVLAALLLGMLVGMGPSGDTGRLLGAGFLGSFSTYSTWMVEGVFMVGVGSCRQVLLAAMWILGMLSIGILAYGLGHTLAG